jgi:transposase
VKARTACPEPDRQHPHHRPGDRPNQVRPSQRNGPHSRLARLRPAGDPVHTAVLTALKSLAPRVKELTAEHQALVKALDSVVSLHNPGLRAAHGVGPDTAAQLLVTAGGNPERMLTEASFAALCGAAPVPASSGRTNRHRLRTSRHRHQARESARRTLPLSQAAGHSGRPAGVAGGFKCQVAGPRYVRTAVSPSGFPRSETTPGA